MQASVKACFTEDNEENEGGKVKSVGFDFTAFLSFLSELL